ncbi:MAG: NADH-quinone oxidoreductase subunit NuoE family protein [Planctomycetota bacterium]|jgi:NADH:ubiquinone oxidoreductase subunit E/ferredoxin
MATAISYLLPMLILAGLLGLLAFTLIMAERLLVNYGTCRIDVNSGEEVLDVEGGQTLLGALQDAGMHIPSACAGKGSCGYCKVTVVVGGGQLLPTERPFLSRAEIRKGVRLACQVKIRNDIGITVPDFLDTIKDMVKNRTYNPDLRWHWRIPSPARDAEEVTAETDAAAPEVEGGNDREFLEKTVEEHAGRKGGLIASLQAVNEHYRYLPAHALSHISTGLDVPLSRVYSLATFYNAFSLTPKGRCTVKVCLGTACHVKGAMRIIERLERELDIKEGETTSDRAFTLEGVRCLGCCGLAPVLTFDEEVHGSVKPAQMPKLLKAKRAELEEAVPEEAVAVGSN